MNLKSIKCKLPICIQLQSPNLDTHTHTHSVDGQQIVLWERTAIDMCVRHNKICHIGFTSGNRLD